MNRKEQAAASRARLVEAARQVFTEHGYDAASVAEVLRRAGMARGALYHYFPGGKRELFTAVFEVINEEWHRRRDAARAYASPLARLRQGMAVFIELCTADEFARIVLTDAPARIPGQAELGTSYRLLREQLEQAVTAGETGELDVEPVARMLYGAVRSAGEYVIGAADRQRAAAAATASINLLLNGLLPPAER